MALAIPDAVAQSLMLIQGGVPGARWQAREQLHLTLRFIGDVDGRDAAMLYDALAAIHLPAFDLQLHAAGQFGGKQIHSLWAGVRKNEALEHLQRKVDTAIRRVGQTPNRSGGGAQIHAPCHPGAAAPSRAGQGAGMAHPSRALY